MAKTKISNGDLMALFFVEMRQSQGFPIGMHVAIIPEGSGWTAVVSSAHRSKHPEAAKRVEAIQKRLRAQYRLARD